MNDRKLIRLKVCGKTFNAVDSGGTFPDGTRLPFRLAEEILEREVLAEKRIWLKVVNRNPFQSYTHTVTCF